MNIPLAKPYMNNEEILAIASVLNSGWLMQGEKVFEFESMIANFTGAKIARATSSCTTALHLALLSLGIGKGDEVLVPSFTYIASANAIEYTGAKPIFIDIDPKTFNIDVQKVEEYLAKNNSKTKCIMPVHLFGLSADMNPLIALAKHYDLHIIEDAACALGTLYHNVHVGRFRDAGCFSFHPRKIITTGEGGMLITNDREIASNVSSLRNHGINNNFTTLSYNYKMTDIQGAIGIEQMKKLPFIISEKVRRTTIYNEQLCNNKHFRLPFTPNGYYHAYQSYVIQLNKLNGVSLNELNGTRNRIMYQLEGAGIETRQGTYAVHALSYYKNKYNLKDLDYPNSFYADRLSIALPLYPQMTDLEQEYVIENLLKVVKRCFL